MKLSEIPGCTLKLVVLAALVLWLRNVIPRLGVANPVRIAQGAAVGAELRQYAMALERTALSEEPWPVDFQAYLRKEFHSPAKDVSVDPWGNPYQLSGNRDRYELRSAGPDRQYGTRDDYTYEGSITGPNGPPPTGLGETPGPVIV